MNRDLTWNSNMPFAFGYYRKESEGRGQESQAIEPPNGRRLEEDKIMGYKWKTFDSLNAKNNEATTSVGDLLECRQRRFASGVKISIQSQKAHLQTLRLSVNFCNFHSSFLVSFCYPRECYMAGTAYVGPVVVHISGKPAR